MKFLAITLIVHGPDPITGGQKSTQARFREVVDNAVLAGSAGYYVTERSQDALATYRPIYDFQRAVAQRAGLPHPWADFEDYVARSSALIGSPEQVIDKVHRYHDRFGHTVMHVHADAHGLTPAQHRDSLTLFGDRIAPTLNRSIPDPPWPTPATEPIGALV